MGSIPLDFQRQCEQRWAARFQQPKPLARWHRFEKQDQELAAQSGQEKTNKLNLSDSPEA
jgi:hypothetical protein